MVDSLRRHDPDQVIRDSTHRRSQPRTGHPCLCCVLIVASENSFVKGKKIISPTITLHNSKTAVFLLCTFSQVIHFISSQEIFSQKLLSFFFRCFHCIKNTRLPSKDNPFHFVHHSEPSVSYKIFFCHLTNIFRNHLSAQQKQLSSKNPIPLSNCSIFTHNRNGTHCWHNNTVSVLFRTKTAIFSLKLCHSKDNLRNYLLQRCQKGKDSISKKCTKPTKFSVYFWKSKT